MSETAVPSFETLLDQLQAVVRQLEGGQLPLEEALQAFERGVGLARTCQEQLSAAEKRVEMVAQRPANPAETL